MPVVCAIFIVAAVVQCVYALYLTVGWLRLQRQQEASVTAVGISIIICARNAAADLSKNLPAILPQRYATSDGRRLFEVIVVDDASTDGTEELLRSLAGKHTHLKVVTVGPDEVRVLKGKRHALAKGVANASYDRLLLTDADCTPASEDWVALMASAFAKEGIEMVAGYGAYKRTHGTLNMFIRWETMHTFLQFACHALNGLPYMATGRNMACSKSLMQRVIADPRWNEVTSGDDDMLVQIAATRTNVAVVADERAFTWSPAKNTFAEWVAQKQRHLSTGKYYDLRSKILLAMYALSQAAIWSTFFMALATPCIFYIMLFRCVLYWGLWALVSKKLRAQVSVIFFPLLDVGWMIYNFAFLPYIAFKNKRTWT
jgi:glycosyltransferase involved in cell wall biosynthesis